MIIATPIILPSFLTAKNFPTGVDEILVPFDVNSLYRNIPIVNKLNILKDYVDIGDQFTRKTTILQESFPV